MSYWARLVYGHRYLDLATAPYDIGLDFSPPPLNRAVNFAGSSRNGLDGSKRIGEQYGDRNWSVSFRVLGNSETECNEATSKLSTFLENTRDPQFRLYFEYAPQNAIGALPIWGQGIYRYHVKDAYLSITSNWGVRDKWIGGIINFLIAPTAEGLRQRLASAMGQIYEETFDTPTGISRGIVVGNPITNLCKNPVFNHTTWNNGWATSGSIVAEKNTDSDYILFDDVSVKLTNTYRNAGTSDYSSTVILGSGTAYAMSCFVKKPGGGVLGTADIQFCRGGTALGSFNSINFGNDWYRIYDYFNAPASGTITTGLRLFNPTESLYIDGFQVEATDTTLVNSPNVITFGDELGCSWSGTRGNSTSSSGTALLKLPVTPENFNPAEGCIRMAMKWNCNNTYNQVQTLFDTENAAGVDLQANYYAADDKVRFFAGGTLVTGNALTFNPNDIYIFHFVWGNDEYGIPQVSLYTNGSAVTTNSYLYHIMPDYIYIGNSYGMTSPLNATILDFTIFRQYIDAAHIAADYAQISQWVMKGDLCTNKLNDIRVYLGNHLNSIPYFWTKDGDNVTDSYYDINHNDWAVVAGIPGNLPAHSMFDVTISSGTPTANGLLLANLAYDKYLDMTNTTYAPDVALNVGTVPVSFPTAGSAIEVIRDLDAYRGKKGYVLAYLSDAGTASQGAMVIHYDTEANAFLSDYISLATDVTPRWFLVGPKLIPESIPEYLDWMQGLEELNFKLKFKRITGSGTLTMNYYRLMVGDISYTPITGLSGTQNIILDGQDAYSYAAKEDGFVTTYGDIIELEPGKYNHLNVIPMQIARPVIDADTVTFNRTYIIPRWSTV